MKARQSKPSIAMRKLGRLSIAERILLGFSKHPDDVDQTASYEAPTKQWTVDTALSQLTQAFPGFVCDLRGKRVLDYGCGDGFQSVAMAKAGAASVLGVEIDANRRAHALACADREQTTNVSFAETINGEFDVIISLNAMEHFTAPQENLAEMKNALAPGGKIYLSFGPMWLAPFGAHMYFFSAMPWINLFFSEHTVFRIRSLYRDDGATSYEPGLNKMTLAKFESLIAKEGLEQSYRAYHCVQNLPLASSIPIAREFLVTQIDAVLSCAAE